jgi:hypothetical protein
VTDSGAASDPQEETKDEAPEETIPGVNPKRGLRRRRKLRAWLEEEEDLLTGTTHLMSGDDPASTEHRMVFKGARLTGRGGPAREVIQLVRELLDSVQAIMPTAEPGLAHVGAGNSIVVKLYASEQEVAEALARRAAKSTGDTAPPAPDDDAPGDDDTDDDARRTTVVDVDGLPDTALAVAVLTEIIAYEEPEQAAARARSISIVAADSLRDLAVTLADHEVALAINLGDDEQVEATPEWAIQVAEYLDAASEEPPAVIKVIGILQGANARGEGEFEIETDEQVPLDSRIGSRMRPGDVVKGKLTPQAIRQIQADNLWNRHVIAEIEVVRRRRGRSVRVEGRRLLSVRPRFEGSGANE